MFGLYFKEASLSKTSELETIDEPMVEEVAVSRTRVGYSWFLQILRFSIVGILNTGIDVLTLNVLVLLFPTHNANFLLLFNSIAYIIGALNSFLLNKFWTFQRKYAITGGELLRFAIINIIGIICNDAIVWSAAQLLHTLITNTVIWADASKFCAVIGTAFVTYLGMRMWVFASKHYKEAIGV